MTNYRNAFTALLIAAALGIGYLLGDPDRTNDSTIGGDAVPRHLDCEEDEAITYHPLDPSPRNLSCVHLDDLAGE